MPHLPLYVVRRATTPPTIDGLLDEPDWLAAELMVLKLTDTGDAPRQRTEVRLLWDETNLYVGFHCIDDDVWATITDRDGHLWEEEVVEVFVDEDGDGKTYVELEVNPRNALVDLYVINRTGRREDMRALLDWNSALAHAVHVDGDPTRRDTKDRSWTAEWAIPLTDFATAPHLPPENGDAWRANFYRIDRGRERDEYSAWSPTGAINYHVPAKFGTIVFSTEPVRKA